MCTPSSDFLTPQEYLEIERNAQYKSEYYGGEMHARSGAKFVHNRVTANLTAHLGLQLSSTQCGICSCDQRVFAAPSVAYTYPDILVVCDEPRFQDDSQDTLLNPALIVEVLSCSTEAFDRGEKFAYYRTIEDLKGYLMVGSEDMTAELWERQSNSRWMLVAEGHHPEDTIEIESIGCRLKLSDVYAKVKFPERRPGARPRMR